MHTPMMNLHMRFCLAIVVAAAVAAAAHAAGPVAAAPALQTGFAVAAQDDLFAPQHITIEAGDTVTWRNTGANPHTVTDERDAWDSGTMDPGASFSRMFSTPGSYPYYCRFHRGVGMIGTVVVAARGDAPPAAAPPAPAAPAKRSAPPAAQPYYAPPAAQPYYAPPAAQPYHVPAGAPYYPPAPAQYYAPPAAHYAPGTIYFVRRGDTILSIARRFGVAPMAIVQANHIRNPNLIFVGQRLVIPGHMAARPPGAGCHVHVVRFGETVFRIALRYGTTVHAIAAANGINPNVIFAGQRLLICPPY